MKGVVFNLFEQIVSRDYGEDAWDDLLDAAGVDGAYTSLGSYPDADLLGLVQAASTMLELPPQDVVRWLGRNSMPLLGATYPQFFLPHHNARDFVLTLNDIIHPEVRKVYPGADVPDFQFDTTAPDVLVMRYNSARRLCSFAEGLLEGAANHYRQSVSIAQPQCMLQGASECVLEITFGEVDAA